MTEEEQKELTAKKWKNLVCRLVEYLQSGKTWKGELNKMGNLVI